MKKGLVTMAACATFALNAQIPGGAISTYPFCGNANDISGSNNGQVVGATLTTDRFGNANNAYYFNGQPNCYINLGTSSSLKMQEGTISVWARPDGFSNAGSGYLLNPVILTKNQPGSNCYEGYAIGLVTANSTPEFHATITQPFCNQVNNIYGTVLYQNWYHLALVWNYSAVKFYVNGVLNSTLTKGFTNSYLASDSVMIGNSANIQNSRYFLGAIDDAIFYPKPLTAQEITQLYNDTTLMCSAVNVPQNEPSSAVNWFPNPACDGVSITNITPGDKYELQIFDACGRLVAQKMVTTENNYISVAELPEGVYVLFLFNDRFHSSDKLIIQR